MKKARWWMGILVLVLVTNVFCGTIFEIVKTGTAEEVLSEIASGSINVNTPDASGSNLLIMALQYSPYFEVIESLIEAGADVNMPDEKGLRR